MTFEEILDEAIAMLQRRGRLTYGALKRQFQLDDAYLDDLKAELIEGQRVAVDEDGRVLVWTGGTEGPPTPTSSIPPSAPQRSRRHGGRLLRLHRLARMLNAASSPCCFVTWWTQPCSPASSTRKSCAT
jgi:hypothetical protein